MILYFITPTKWRYLILLVSSYYFYMSWNPNYVFLILFTTFISYFTAIKIENSVSKINKKLYLTISILSSLSVLFFYKYFNFFGSTINELFRLTNIDVRVSYYSLLLPVGISFYTFQTLSYSIDVYKGKIKTERHFGIYALYVSFFPQLVAGPIERSTNLLPQFREKQELCFKNFVMGFKWIIIGLFMKLVVADRLSLYVDAVYNNVYEHSGLTYLIATVLFAYQIFCDFAGYSSIAIGVSRTMGYQLMTNFRRPYFASSISDFWHRWHISLSTWFRDYFYIPLGGSRVGIPRWYFNLFLTFLISGLWHGASWTFVIWGALHGIYIVIENMFKLQLKKYKKTSIIERLSRIILVFCLVNFAWIFFRANNVEESFYIIRNLFDWEAPIYLDYKVFFYGFLGLMILFFHDYVIENNEDSILLNNDINIKVLVYYVFLIFMTLYIGVFNGGQFIYFQF